MPSDKNPQVNEKTGQKDKYTTMLEEKFKVSCVEFDDQGQNTLHRSARDQNWKVMEEVYPLLNKHTELPILKGKRWVN